MNMIACFIGSEAVAIHGKKKALEQTLEVVPVTTEELDETIKYYREHGYTLAWITKNMVEHTELWTAMTK